MADAAVHIVAGDEVSLFDRGWRSMPEFVEQKIEPIDWIVRGLMARGGISVLSGPARSLKSWLMMHLALSAVTGTPAINVFETVKSSVMILQLEESRRQSHRKFHMIASAVGLTSKQLSEGQLFVRNGVPFKMHNPEHRKAFLEEFRQVQPDLIFLDSLKRIHNLPEKDDAWVSDFVDWVNELRAVNPLLHFCAIHHHRKGSNDGKKEDAGEMLRGSSDLLAVLDGHIAFKRKSKGVYIAEHDKNRDDEELEPFLVNFEVVDGRAFISHGGPADDKGTSETSEAEQKILDYFSRLGDEAKVTCGDVAKAVGLPRQTCQSALGRIIRSGGPVRYAGTRATGVGDRVTTLYSRPNRNIRQRLEDL